MLIEVFRRSGTELRGCRTRPSADHDTAPANEFVIVFRSSTISAVGSDSNCQRRIQRLLVCRDNHQTSNELLLMSQIFLSDRISQQPRRFRTRCDQNKAAVWSQMALTHGQQH